MKQRALEILQDSKAASGLGVTLGAFAVWFTYVSGWIS